MQYHIWCLVWPLLFKQYYTEFFWAVIAALFSSVQPSGSCGGIYTVYHKREVCGLFSGLPHAGLGSQRGKEQCAGKICKIYWAVSPCAAEGMCCSWRSEFPSFGREQRKAVTIKREERGKWSNYGRARLIFPQMVLAAGNHTSTVFSPLKDYSKKAKEKSYNERC